MSADGYRAILFYLDAFIWTVDVALSDVPEFQNSLAISDNTCSG